MREEQNISYTRKNLVYLMTFYHLKNILTYLSEHSINHHVLYHVKYCLLAIMTLTSIT